MGIDESLSQAEIYQILFSALSTVDSILQIWLTITFAVLVAAFLAGKRINHFMYVLIAALYGLASIVLITRFISAAALMFHFQSLLVMSGYKPWPVPSLIGEIIGAGTAFLFLGGTIGTIWFAHSTRKAAMAGGS